jgi:hypothetical protein
MTTLERVDDLVTRTTDSALSWHRELDESLSAWDASERITLRRSGGGQVRLALTVGRVRMRLDSSDANLTGSLVALWQLADASAAERD